MFEREIQFIYDFSHNKIKSLGSFITFSQLKSTDLHPAILQYISAEIDFYIFEDRQKLLKDSLFDYSGNKINSYFMMISEEIKKTKKFSVSYIEKLILHSVTFTINHLVSPNSLTSQFIFEEDNEKSASEVKQILNYLYYYPHVKKIISVYLDKKNLLKITSEDFKELLKKIDNIGFTENPGKIYQEALESMADFFNIGMSGRTMVPLIAVQNYLKDKNLNAHMNKLKSEFVDPEITRYEIKDYQKLLVSVKLSESKSAGVAETEEVLESELSENTAQPTAFETVEENEEATLDLKIKEGESTKVILDEETVEEIDNKSGGQTGSEKDKTAEVAGVDDKGTKTAAGSGNKPEKAPSEEKPAGEPETETDIIDIEDDSGVEGEAFEEVMELAKEEKNIATDEDLEGKELIPEDDDKSLSIIDDIKDEANKLAKGRQENTEEGGEETDDTVEKIEEQDSSQGSKHPLGFQVTSNIKEEEAESEQITSEQPEDKPDTGEIDNSPADSAIKTDEEELKEQESDSKDTLSYLLDDDDNLEETDKNSPEPEKPENVTDKSKAEEISIPFESDENVKSNKEKKRIEKPAAPKRSHIDITSLLEDRKITKVIDAIFDYDMEEFANTIEMIGEAPSLGSANQIIDKVCSASQISTSSKEVKLFKSIISDYYDRK